MTDVELTYSEKQVELFYPERFPKYTIVPKGRRAGLTRGAAHFFIECGIDDNIPHMPPGPLYFLWGDTISGNIDRYYERYFKPALDNIPTHLWKWRAQDRILIVGRLTVDFRSADRPENWEGFGYHLIFLNEAGIILEDDYLFDNAVLAMLIDFPDSKLIAAGVPKGKRHKNGEHKFYKLYKTALEDKENYRIVRMVGMDNPFIAREEIEKISDTMDDETKRQEIDGEFIDITQKKYLYTFSSVKNVIEDYKPNIHLPILVSFDFNVEPMTATIGQKLNVRHGVIFDKIRINTGSTEEVCEEFLVKYPQWLHNTQITGDATGHNREKARKGNITSYQVIKQMLQLKDYDIRVPRSNKAHKDSRQLCCSVVQHADFYITKSCQEVINDCVDAAVDDKGELIKSKEQGRHFFDNVRYTIHEWYPDFITAPHKYRK